MALDKAKIKEDVGRFMASRNWSKALEELQKLVILEARDPQIRVWLGDVHRALGNPTRAVEEYRKALKLLDKSPDRARILSICRTILGIDRGASDIEDIVKKHEVQTAAPEVTTLSEEIPSIPLFSEFTDDEFKRVLAKAKALKVPPETVIVKEGDRGDSLFFISSGEVKVFKKTKDDRQVLVETLKVGDFFGEFGFFSDSTRHASVVAASDVELLEMSKAAFEEVIKEFPRVSEVLVEFYKVRILDTLLALSPLFRGLSSSDRKQLINRFRLIVVNGGEEIVKEGEMGDALYLIKSGVVEVVTHDPRGGAVVLAQLTEGDFFGEIALITGAPRTATVKAVKETRLMRLGKEDFQEIVTSYPEVAKVARSYLEKRAENTINVLMTTVKETGGLV